MKVKIGDTIHDASLEPIMLILSPQDKENIANMDEEATKFGMFPDTFSQDEIIEFMDIKNAK